jgi:hypothetical protein
MIGEIPKRTLSFILIGVGCILTVLPILMPNSEWLIAVTRNNGSYLTAISMSQFIGIRFGFIIVFGLAMFILGAFLIRQNPK